MDKDINNIFRKAEKNKKVQLISVGASLVYYARQQANEELAKIKKKGENAQLCQ